MTTKKKRKMAVVTGDEEPAPLLHRRPSGTTAVAAVAIAERLDAPSLLAIWSQMFVVSSLEENIRVSAAASQELN